MIEHPRPTTAGSCSATRAEGVHGDIGTEVQDVEPAALEDVGDHPQAEHVVLALDCRQQDALARTRLDPSGTECGEDPEQRPVADRRCQMLVGHRQSAAFPQIADPLHRGADHERLHNLGRHAGGERAIDDTVGRGPVANP